MHCSKRSRAARANSSDADGHSIVASSRSKLIGEPSSFGEKVQACLNAASHIWEICSSSVLVQGTTLALYRNTGATPIFISSSFRIGESTLSRPWRSADKCWMLPLRCGPSPIQAVVGRASGTRGLGTIGRCTISPSPAGRKLGSFLFNSELL
jgi:hypothetical protein